MNDKMLYFQLFSINSIHLIYIKIISQAKCHNIGMFNIGEYSCIIYDYIRHTIIPTFPFKHCTD